MKNFIKVLAVLLIVGLVAGCGATKSEEPAKDELKKIVVGATPVPHSDILNLVVDDLKAQGYDLEIKEFTDYVTPNTALNDGQIDANFFQHQPYLDSFVIDQKMPLVSVAGIHIEPMAGYSKKIKDISEITEGSKIAIPNDATNEGRALLLLEKQGLIKLKDSTNLAATPIDIAENKLNLEFSELEAAQLPRVLDDVALAVINTNFALEADLSPLKDSLFIEGDDSPYVNILVSREDNKDSEEIQALVKALKSDEVKNFITENYKGAVVPAFK